MPIDYSSPGQALARQRRTERRLVLRAEKAAEKFLAETRRLALKLRLDLTPVVVQNTWADCVTSAMADLPAAQREYLALESWTGMAENAYSMARTLISASSVHDWATSRLDNALRSTLTLDRPMGGVVTAAGTADAGDAWGEVSMGFEMGPDGEMTITFDDDVSLAPKFAIERELRTRATGMAGKNDLAGMTAENYSRKRWVSRRDEHTRPTHLEADGQTVAVGELFIVGGSSLMYPGDQSAHYAEVVNCRCCVIGVNEESP